MPESEATGARLVVRIRPHWVNTFVLRPFARPYVRVDGVEHRLRWNVETALEVTAGQHVVQTFVRYKGTSVNLGTGRLDVGVRPGERLQIRSRNSWLNQSPFVPVVVARTDIAAGTGHG